MFLYEEVSGLTYSTLRFVARNRMSQEIGPLQTAMQEKLTDALQPIHLEIINESYMHNAPKGSESHFKIVVVSEKFKSVPLIQRHRLVNEALKYELENGIHALSIMAKTPEQWENSAKTVSPSPPCRGGFGK